MLEYYKLKKKGIMPGQVFIPFLLILNQQIPILASIKESKVISCF